MPDLDKVYDHLLSQYSDVPNWQRYYKVFCECTDELRVAIVDWMTGRYLETSEGYWLDVCGIILGLPRPEVWDEDAVFTWDSSTFNERWDQGVWSTPRGIRTGIPVSDGVYRPLLRAKAVSSYSNSSIYDIARTIYVGFGIDITVQTFAPRVIHLTFREAVTQWQRYYVKVLAPVQADTELLFTN